MMATSNTRQTRKSKNSRFRRGSGVYMCQACSLMTRETGKGESELRLCVECYHGKPGDEVAVASGTMSKAAFDAKWVAVPTPKPDPFDFTHPVSQEDKERFERVAQRRREKRQAALRRLLEAGI